MNNETKTTIRDRIQELKEEGLGVCSHCSGTRRVGCGSYRMGCGHCDKGLEQENWERIDELEKLLGEDNT